MTDKYVIKLNDEDDFDLYINGVLDGGASFIGGLLVIIASREGVVVPTTRFLSESYILAILRESGLDIEIDGGW